MTSAGAAHEKERFAIDLAPGRLWSLWGMLQVYADSFYEATSLLARVERIVSEHKSKSVLINPDGSATINYIQDQVILGVIKSQAQKLSGECRALGAEITLELLMEFRDELQSGKTTFEDVGRYIGDIETLLKRELKRTLVFALNAREKNLWEPNDPLFGREFSQRFVTQGVFEIDEAAKCMALSRPTAAVFHLMRVMEVGIRSVARCLGISDPLRPANRSWGPILRSIRDGIDAKWPTTTLRMHGDGALFDDLYASLDAVKNPWRNSTMHVEDKKTESEAEHIFVAVKAFMMKLASRCDENGEPKA